MESNGKKSETEIYDYIVIGGGVGGLYANWKLNAQGKSGILLEKESEVGGRLLEVMFHGHLIKLGAGIMAEHNTHLLKLLSKLKLKYSTFKSETKTLLEPFPMESAISQIKKVYRENKSSCKNMTSIEFLKAYFDSKFVKNFVENCEYRDWLESDIGYFIKYYNIDDMSHSQYNVLYFNWTDLANKLKLPNCICSHEVKKINKLPNGKYQVDGKYIAKKLYVCTTLKPVDKLIGKFINFSYGDYVGTIPFVRIYTWHAKPYDTSKISHYNIVPNQLEKIIKITPNILMASYSDNSGAKYWKSVNFADKKTQIKKVENKLRELSIGINKVDDVEICWWEEGVHYYKPFGNQTMNQVIKKLLKPTKGIYVIGEITSKKHGWVEGAIQSVNSIII